MKRDERDGAASVPSMDWREALTALWLLIWLGAGASLLRRLLDASAINTKHARRSLAPFALCASLALLALLIAYH